VMQTATELREEELIKPGDKLTLRVLHALARGFSSKEIAAFLECPEKTVNSAIERAQEISGAANTIALMNRLWAAGIINGVNAPQERVPIRPQERVILELRAEGHTTQGVGRKIQVAPRVVKTTLSQIILSFKARNEAHALVLYRQQERGQYLSDQPQKPTPPRVPRLKSWLAEKWFKEGQSIPQIVDGLKETFGIRAAPHVIAYQLDVMTKQRRRGKPPDTAARPPNTGIQSPYRQHRSSPPTGELTERER
jgi:DNA-binding NarL/FixJ family response regulator